VPDSGVSSHIDVTSNVALITENEALPVRVATPKDDLVASDLANPAAAQVVTKISGVLRFLQDTSDLSMH
jgi:hypothetical protein